MTGAKTEGLEQRPEGLSIRLSCAQTVLTDAVIAGIGIVRNTDLAKRANLEVSNGIEVNEFLQASAPTYMPLVTSRDFQSGTEPADTRRA
jgi:3-phenylpropionate/trans-cinnamate dioxygenase ferredoxin reductase subunit